MTQKAFKIFIPHVGTQFYEKKGEELPQLCVCKHGYRSKFPFTHGNTHTTMATPLPFSVDNSTVPTCGIAIWVMFFFLGVNESNYNFWDQEINLKGGRISLGFFI